MNRRLLITTPIVRKVHRQYGYRDAEKENPRRHQPVCDYGEQGRLKVAVIVCPYCTISQKLEYSAPILKYLCFYLSAPGCPFGLALA